MAINISTHDQESRLVVTVEGDLNNTATKQAVESFAPIFKRTDCDIVIEWHDSSIYFNSPLLYL